MVENSKIRKRGLKSGAMLTRRSILAGAAGAIIATGLAKSVLPAAAGEGAATRPRNTLGIQAVNVLNPAGPGAIRFTGFINDRMQACIDNLTMAQSVERIVAPCRIKADSNDWGWRGSFWGQWFDAAAMAYGYDPKSKYKAKLDAAVRGLLAGASPDGYIGSYTTYTQVYGAWDVFNRKWTLLGLLDYYDITGDKKVLAAAARSVDHLMSRVGPGRHYNITDLGCGPWKGDPPSSILGAIVKLFNRTGDKRYLNYASYIVDQWSKPSRLNPAGMRLVQAALAGQPPKRINAADASELTSCFEGVCELYRVTGKREYLDACINYARGIINCELTVVGSGSAGGVWNDGQKRQANPESWTMDTSVTAAWMFYCFQLLQLTGDPIYAEQLEVSLHNALLGAMTPTGSWFAFFSALGGQRVPSLEQCPETYNAMLSSAVCNGQRGLMLTPYWAVMTGGDGEIAVNLYNAGSSNLRLANGQSVHLHQITAYPDDGTVRIVIDPDNEADFTVMLRIPPWSNKNRITVNGAAETTRPVPGAYAKVRRKWKKGDLIELSLDMRGRITRDPAGSGAVAVARGPIVLAVDSRITHTPALDGLRVDADNHGRVKLAANARRTKATAFRQVFDVPMIGSGGERRTIAMCDFASAGNGWSKSSLYRVWLSQPLAANKLWEGLTPWTALTWKPSAANQVPSPFITAWRYAAYTQDIGKMSAHHSDGALTFGSPGGKADWRPVPVPPTRDVFRPIVVDVRQLLGTDDKAALFQTIMTSATSQKAILELEGTSILKAWLNGKMVWWRASAGGSSQICNQTQVRLRRGTNVLLLAISPGTGETEIGARLLPLPGFGFLSGLRFG